MGDKLADGTGVIITYGNCEFSRDVILRFPELKEDLEFDRDLLHCQVGTPAEAIKASVESGDTMLPNRICEFLGGALHKEGAISEIENAIAISFVQPSELRKSDTGMAVLNTMPESIRSIILDYEKRQGVW